MVRANSQHGSGPDLGGVCIICGSGSLPIEIANSAIKNGIHPYLAGIVNEAEPGIEAFDHSYLAMGQVSKLLAALRERNIQHLIFAGGIKQRPPLSKLKLDHIALSLLSKVAFNYFGGDAKLLDSVVTAFEKRGLQVVGVKDVAPELVTQLGIISGPSPNKKTIRNIDLGIKACQKLGELDTGQAAVVEAERIIALEAAEGTAALLDRVATVRSMGRLTPDQKGGVLVKMPKPDQDLRIDMPAIGPRTVEGAAKAGLAGIAVQAGGSLILQKQETQSMARKLGLFIYGIPTDEGCNG